MPLPDDDKALDTIHKTIIFEDVKIAFEDLVVLAGQRHLRCRGIRRARGTKHPGDTQ